MCPRLNDFALFNGRIGFDTLGAFSYTLSFHY